MSEYTDAVANLEKQIEGRDYVERQAMIAQKRVRNMYRDNPGDPAIGEAEEEFIVLWYEWCDWCYELENQYRNLRNITP